jgi:hypothetical protein
MPDVTIDRLTLKLGGLSERDGRRLARLVASGLARAWDLDQAATTLQSVRVDLTAHPGAGGDQLSERIVAAIARQLRLSLGD